MSFIFAPCKAPTSSSLPAPGSTPALINYVKPEVLFIVDTKNTKKKKEEVFQKKEIANRCINTDINGIETTIENIVLSKNNWKFINI